jgi:hypothetical protein
MPRKFEMKKIEKKIILKVEMKIFVWNFKKIGHITRGKWKIEMKESYISSMPPW